MDSQIKMQGNGRMGWLNTWIQAITQPSEETYERIANDPGATTGTAFLWVAIGGLVAGVVTIGFGGFRSPGGDDVASSIFTGLLCGAVFFPIISVVLFATTTGISQLIARALGGVGTYRQLAYAYAAAGLPIALISNIISIIPFLGLLGFLLAPYSLVLQVIAMKAVNKFSWGRAILSSSALLAAILILLAIIVIVTLALLGPAIGNIFEGIIQDIQTAQ